MTSLIILVVVMLAAVVALKIFLPERELKSSGAVYNYKKKDFLMTRAEHEFFDVLVEAVGVQYYVFPQVHLDDILEHKVKGQNWRGAFRHINEKSVDFVICDKNYIKPLLAIELDDRSHDQEDRKERDGEVERVLSCAGLPLIRFGNNGHFDKEEVKRLVLEKLNQ